MASLALYAGAGLLLLGLVALLHTARARRGSRRRAVALAVGGLLLAFGAGGWPPAEQRVAHPRSALDTFVPRYQFGERHTLHVDATPEAAYRAVLAVTADDIRCFRLLTWIRRLGRDGPASILNAPHDTPILDVARQSGFLVLAELPGREVVYGNASPTSAAARAAQGGLQGGPRTAATPAAFRDLDGPGYAKLATNFRVEPDARGATVVTETRVFATDAGTRRLFALYWRAIYPGSALLRRSWLAAIRRRALGAPTG